MTLPPRLRLAALPLLVYVLSAGVFMGVAGDRLLRPSPDNHYAHLAHSWLEGQLHVVGNRPPGTNDWACFDTVKRGPCPPNQYSFHGKDAERYRWYVSFPPAPALVMVPFVAAFGTAVPDRLIWTLVAALAPLFLFLLLRHLGTLEELPERSLRDDLVLTALFAFGTVFFFTAVQGTVWFAAHALASALLFPYLRWSLGARRPLLAGLALGIIVLCRPTTAVLSLFFGLEALRATHEGTESPPEGTPWWRRVGRFVRHVRWRPALGQIALFSPPILLLGAVAMWMNAVRFDDPFAFGHEYLQIRWRPRIEKWGLFNYHYLGRNLGIFLGSLPWLSAGPPYITISRHGLALWVTTPGLLLALWPRKTTTRMAALWIAVVPVALLNLLYQNSGWVQFGYRFALDYLPLVFVLLYLGRRRFGPGFLALAVFSVAINAFGAATFNRMPRFYDNDATQSVIFQPD